MKNRLILFAFLLFSNAHAQENFFIEYDNIKRNHIYIEAYSILPDYSTGYFSINYEYAFGNKRKTSVRLGFYPSFDDKGYVFPLLINWITAPQKKHHFEYGFGPVLGFEVDDKNNQNYFVFGGALVPLMYRFQGNRGIFCRTGINVFISYPTVVSPSISLGYKF